MDRNTQQQTSGLRRLLSKIHVSRAKRLPSSVPRVKRSLLSLKFTTSPTYTPTLPPEIWVLIIRYAVSPIFSQSYPRASCSDPTFIPWPNPDESVSFLAFPHSHSHLQQRLACYESSLRYKASLTRVCKEWYAMAQEVLYEFVWISRSAQAQALAWTLNSYAKLNTSNNDTSVTPGHHIRRLHIETPALERCCPAVLRTILDHTPRLTIYSDYHSIRRQTPPDPRSTPEQLLSALVRPGNSLRRLSWTNYEYDCEDYHGGVSFYVRVVGPRLEATAANLEFLELNFCSRHLHSMGSHTTSSTSLNTATLTSHNLTLPALRSLKVTLDAATFFVLSTWSMPLLQNLSVLSADFSYAGDGFARFFLEHGAKLTQLELGHSTGAIEEHYLTAPPLGTGPGVSLWAGPIPLAAWCPNLLEFICSADAEWNWQNPDWIAPHVLLPTHPSLEFIGIRDMEKRLIDDINLSAGRLREYGWDGERAEDEEDDPFFMLFEQMGSLLRREAFPSLRYVRDMSWGSDVMRRSGRVGSSMLMPPIASVSLRSSPSHRFGLPEVGGLMANAFGISLNPVDVSSASKVIVVIERGEEERRRALGQGVLRFWRKVLERCGDRGVWLEDCRGVNVTMGDLRRAEITTT